MDVTLEVDLRAAEVAIDASLADPSAARRQVLLATLEHLDQQIALSDDYESRIVGSAAFGHGSKGSVIGETGSVAAAEEIPQAELVAQTVLIKAATREVTATTPESLADLRAAGRALAAMRGEDAPAP